MWRLGGIKIKYFSIIATKGLSNSKFRIRIAGKAFWNANTSPCTSIVRTHTKPHYLAHALKRKSSLSSLLIAHEYHNGSLNSVYEINSFTWAIQN